MTPEEAIEILKAHHMWTGEPQEIIDVRKENKALEMAIKALSQEPTDAVSREAVDKAIYDYWADQQCPDPSGYDVWEETMKVINKLPSVQPSRKGHWIKMPLVEAGQTYSHKCSLCGRRILITDVGLSEFPYCHCGAKMIEPQESEDKE